MSRISISKSINFVSPEGSPFRGEAEDGGSGYKADAGDIANTAVAVVAANQPPAVSNLDGDVTSWSEHSAPTLLDTGSSATLTDADSPNFDGGSLTVSIGTGLVAAQDQLLIRATSGISTTGSAVTYNGVQIGTFTGGGAGGSALVISFDPDATVAAVQSLLRAIGYDNSGGDNPVAGTRTINWTLVDGDGGSDTVNITSSVNVVAVNDAPVVGGSFATRTFTEGVNGAADHILVASATTFSDVDSASLAFVRVSITSNFVAAEDVLAFTNTNSATFGDITGNYDGTTGVLTLTSPGGAATIAQFQAAARAVIYDNVSEEPTQNNRTVQVLANDGAANGSLSFFIQVVAQNDSPSGTSSMIPSNEDSVLTLTAGHFGFTDVDGDTLSGVRFGQAPTGGTLYYDSDGAGGAAPVAITSFPSTTYSVADVTAEKLTFVPNANLNGNGAASINFAVVDNGGTTGAGQNADVSPETLTINLTAVNDAPAVDLNAGTAGLNDTNIYVENGSNSGIGADIAVSDIDGGNLQGATVTITDPSAGDELFASLPLPGGITISAASTATNLILAGSASPADYASALGQVGYRNSGDNPTAFGSNTNRVINVTVNDGIADSPPATMTMSVLAVNDAPVNALGATVNIAEDTADEWLSGMSISDPDVDPATDQMYITFQVANGSIEIRTDVPGGIEPGDIIAQAVDTITVLATLNQINATLASNDEGLTYTPNPNFNGDDTLTVYTNDQGRSGMDPGLTADGTSEEGVASRTISVSASEDVAVLADDSATTDEASTVVIDVLANDGDDVDGPNQPGGQKPLIIEIDGQDVAAGETVTLASGATVTFNSNGTLTYNPNGAYEALVAASSGAANGSANDVFTYTVAGNATANVTVTVNGLASAGDIYRGDGSGNMIDGTPGNDQFRMEQGGDDEVDSGAGNDIIYYGGALTAADDNDGGSGTDVVVLQGNYDLTLGAANLVGIEYLSVQSGATTRFGDTANNRYDYDLTTVDENVAAGQRLVVNGQSLLATEDLTFDGSAESDGSFLIYGGQGVDTLTGGDGNDVFFFEGTRWGPGDKVDGGDGADALVIAGVDGINHIEFGETSLSGIESISVNNRFASDPSAVPSYELVLANGNVSSSLIVNGSSLADNQTVSVNGSAVTGGTLTLYGGAGEDSLTGGALGDRIEGGWGGDQLRGGAGNDVFVYRSLADSLASGNRDAIQDFTTGDQIDLSAIDGIDGVAGSAFSFVGDAEFNGVAGELRASNGGGIWTVSGDVDGDKVADFILFVVRGDADPIVGSDFIL